MFPRFAAFDLLAIINTVDLSHRQVFVNVGPALE
jgi:hypothetical protein